MWKSLLKKDLKLGQSSGEAAVTSLGALAVPLVRKGVGWLVVGWISFKMFKKTESIHVMRVIAVESGLRGSNILTDLFRFLRGLRVRLTLEGDTMADALKAAGNDAVRQGNYSIALDHYQQALAAAGDVAGADELATLHSNMSFTHLKLGQFQEAVDEADKTVAIRSNWSKGYFRRGEANFALKEYAKAAKDYSKASELSPDDGTIKKKLALAQEAVNGFYFRQLLPARDFCLSPTNIVERQIFSSAEQMQNFVYLVGDAKTRECVVVDAAWDVNGIRAIVAADNMKLVGAVVTHYHFDHVGGTPPPPFDSLGIKVPGVRELALDDKIKVYINKNDAESVLEKNGVPAASMVVLEDSAVINIGSIKFHFIHTPGHTPGSQCIHIPRADQDILLSGDTLFIGSCGRLDFPDCDPKAMYISLQKKLANLPENTKVYPGHDYGGPFTTIADEKRKGLLRPVSETQWLRNHHRM